MPYLRLYSGNRLQEQRELAAEKTTIGRSEDNDIVLGSSGVSKHHAVVERHRNYFEVVDLDSANGVFVNGERVTRRRLEYWDEIQIVRHVLKFMAVPKLPGEEDRDLGKHEAPARQDETQEVDISNISDLLKLRSQGNSASLISGIGTGQECKHALRKVNFVIGRAAACDLRLSGWLAPATAATVQRRGESYFLLPARRGKVYVNDLRIAEPVRLRDGDLLRVRGASLKFFLRPIGHD